MRKILTVFVALMFVVGFTSVSWAIPFVQNTGFDISSAVSTDAGSNGNDINYYGLVSGTANANLYSELTWGYPTINSGAALGSSQFGLAPTGNSYTDYSGLKLTGYTGDALLDTWTTISTIYHQNRSISIEAFTLAAVDIYSELTVGTTDINTIPITFTETNNQALPCAGPGGLGQCPDEWTFNASGFAPVYFWDAGQKYLAEFQLANLNNAVLDPSNNPILSLWTAENLTSSADVQMKLSAVPEPASMLLFGLGMVGAALRKRFFA